MGSTDAINPETGMEISGRFGTYKLIEKLAEEETVQYIRLK